MVLRGFQLCYVLQARQPFTHGEIGQAGECGDGLSYRAVFCHDFHFHRRSDFVAMYVAGVRAAHRLQRRHRYAGGEHLCLPLRDRADFVQLVSEDACEGMIDVNDVALVVADDVRNRCRFDNRLQPQVQLASFSQAARDLRYADNDAFRVANGGDRERDIDLFAAFWPPAAFRSS